MQCDRCWLNSELLCSFVGHAHEPCRRDPALPSIMGKIVWNFSELKEKENIISQLMFCPFPSLLLVLNRSSLFHKQDFLIPVMCIYDSLLWAFALSKPDRFLSHSKHSSTTSQWCSSLRNLFTCCFLCFFTFHPSPKPVVPISFSLSVIYWWKLNFSLLLHDAVL